MKVGLNRLSDLLKVIQRGENPGLLTSKSLPLLYNMAIICQTTLSFWVKMSSVKKLLVLSQEYFSVNADIYTKVFFNLLFPSPTHSYH